MERMVGCTVQECTLCAALVESRTQIVNGTGPEDADFLIIGEAPGASEDAFGKPFVGRSGEILTQKLREHGLDRDTVRITNCIRCRPPDNRNPRVTELENCRQYLEIEIALVDPELIMTVGKVPSSELLDRDVSVTLEAGSVMERTINDQTYPILISLHPAAMLYDRTNESTIDETFAKASKLIGSQINGSQSRIGDFTE